MVRKKFRPAEVLLGKRKTIKLRTGKYVVWLRGEGPLVVLLHGWPVSSHHWRYLVPTLQKKGFASLCIDLKGLGESLTNDKHFQKVRLAREILTVVDHFYPQAKKFSLVGHDWGGSIAIAISSLVPKRVSCLIVEDEVPPGISAPLQGKSLVLALT